MAKPFEPKVYKKFNKPGIEAVVKHLHREGVYTIHTIENFGVDIKALSYEYGQVLPSIHEVEVKKRWTNGLSEWHEQLRIPYRKEKVIYNNPFMLLYFWIVSSDYTGAYRILGSAVCRSPVEVDVGFIDKFMINPREHWTYIKLL